MEKEKHGAEIERGQILSAKDGTYRVGSITRAGITTMPIKALNEAESLVAGDLVYFFLFPDGDGLILKKM